MPPPIPVALVGYDSRWPQLAAEYSQALRALGPVVVNVHHIGSTSVPGLAAKPIIDLMVLVDDLGKLDQIREDVEGLGYQWHGELGISGRRYCTLSTEAGERKVQLHCFSADSPHVRRHLSFRDYLRAHPEVARPYEIEKYRARGLHPQDSHAYGDEKDTWIRKKEAEALRWFYAQPGDILK